MEDGIMEDQNATAAPDLGRVRQRKVSTKLENFVDDKTMLKEIRTYSNATSKKNTTKKRAVGDSSAGSDSKKAKSISTVPIKRIKPPVIVPVKPLELSVKEKENLRIEDEFVNNERYLKPRNVVVPLPEGASDEIGLADAIIKGVRECSTLLLDWSEPAAKLVGATCKVFWDGENEWFYARILNYDKGYNRHYVYYLADSTAEWISISDEYVFVAEAMVMVRMRGTWPALRYWASPKAVEISKTLPGYHKQCEYIEFFPAETEKNVSREYAFLPSTQFDPIKEEFMPTRPLKRLVSCMDSVKKEKADMKSVVDLVLESIHQTIFERIIGDDWIGIRVRAFTHTISQVNNQEMKWSKQIGTILQYYKVSDIYLIVFDDVSYQPQWINIAPDVIEVFIGPYELENNPIQIRQPLTDIVCMMCGNDGILDTPGNPDTQISGDNSIDDDDGDMININKIDDDKDYGSIFSNISAKQCDSCDRYCHKYCMPKNELFDNNINKNMNNEKENNIKWVFEGEKEEIKVKGKSKEKDLDLSGIIEEEKVYFCLNCSRCVSHTFIVSMFISFSTNAYLADIFCVENCLY
jgi:hypothetical protein